MRATHSTPNAGKKAAVLSFGLLALVCASQSVATTPGAADTASYTWSAELVAFDDATDTVTVRSRTVDPDVANVPGLRAGDRAMLTWSGLTTAAGIRALERGASGSYDRMTLPVEYVSTELDGRYVSFKVQVPADAAAAIANVRPGQWVTATSPHKPKNATEAVRSMRPYGDVG